MKLRDVDHLKNGLNGQIFWITAGLVPNLIEHEIYVVMIRMKLRTELRVLNKSA